MAPGPDEPDEPGETWRTSLLTAGRTVAGVGAVAFSIWLFGEFTGCTPPSRRGHVITAREQPEKFASTQRFTFFLAVGTGVAGGLLILAGGLGKNSAP